MNPSRFLFLIFPLILAACGGRVSDIDGNEYRTVRIGDQVWMAENLRTSTYLDGSPIPQVPDNAQWEALESGAWASYDNNALNIGLYGSLYNGFAVADPRGLCPAGWRVPTDADWSALVAHLGGDAEAGGKLKSIGTTQWTAPNASATDESGFGALPGGYRYKNGMFDHIGSGGYWWTAPDTSASSMVYRMAHYDYPDVAKNTSPMTTGYSVRCVQVD